MKFTSPAVPRITVLYNDAFDLYLAITATKKVILTEDILHIVSLAQNEFPDP